jgi:hypothetical protein
MLTWINSPRERFKRKRAANAKVFFTRKISNLEKLEKVKCSVIGVGSKMEPDQNKWLSGYENKNK